jgi:hypothetical protein
MGLWLLNPSVGNNTENMQNESVRILRIRAMNLYVYGNHAE